MQAFRKKTLRQWGHLPHAPPLFLIRHWPMTLESSHWSCRYVYRAVVCLHKYTIQVCEYGLHGCIASSYQRALQVRAWSCLRLGCKYIRRVLQQQLVDPQTVDQLPILCWNIDYYVYHQLSRRIYTACRLGLWSSRSLIAVNVAADTEKRRT